MGHKMMLIFFLRESQLYFNLSLLLIKHFPPSQLAASFKNFIVFCFSAPFVGILAENEPVFFAYSFLLTGSTR